MSLCGGVFVIGAAIVLVVLLRRQDISPQQSRCLDIEVQLATRGVTARLTDDGGGAYYVDHASAAHRDVRVYIDVDSAIMESMTLFNQVNKAISLEVIHCWEYKCQQPQRYTVVLHVVESLADRASVTGTPAAQQSAQPPVKAADWDSIPATRLGVNLLQGLEKLHEQGRVGINLSPTNVLHLAARGESPWTSVVLLSPTRYVKAATARSDIDSVLALLVSLSSHLKPRVVELTRLLNGGIAPIEGTVERFCAHVVVTGMTDERWAEVGGYFRASMQMSVPAVVLQSFGAATALLQPVYDSLVDVFARATEIFLLMYSRTNPPETVTSSKVIAAIRAHEKASITVFKCALEKALDVSGKRGSDLYKLAALIVHPDKCNQAPGSREAMSILNDRKRELKPLNGNPSPP
jgi:hypothetical protein